MKFIKLLCIVLVSSIVVHAATPLELNKIKKGSFNKDGQKVYSFVLNEKTAVEINVVSKRTCHLRLKKDGSTYEYLDTDNLNVILEKGSYTLVVSGYGNFLINIVATIEIYEGSDYWNWDNTFWGTSEYTGSNTVNARGKFLSHLVSSQTEDFESYTSHRIERLKFASCRIRDQDGLKPLGEERDSVDTYLDWLKRPTSGTRYFLPAPREIILYFDEPISAFGFYYAKSFGLFHTSPYYGIDLSVEYADGTKKIVDSRKCGKHKLCYFSFIEKDSNKLITSISIPTGSEGNVMFDDMTVASDYQVKNMYHGVERELDENDPFLNSSTPWVDTDNDGVADNADKDDDNDGIPDTVERANRLNPLNAADAQGDLDGDGFSNVIEYQMGTNMKNARSKPVWAPVIMGDIMIFIPAKP